jgi:DNA-binding SARP family transcriptional activator
MTPRIKEFINRGILPLVGRERELRALFDAFAGLLEGEPRAVWMTGAPGVGKSRLLDELKARGRDHAARSLVVHAKWYEGEGAELGPLSNALEVLRPALAAPLAARIYRDGMIATVDAAIEAVAVASRRYPIMLILDDLHYLNSSTELSRFVSAMEEIPLLLVVTTRPVENPALRAFRSALSGSIPPLELEIGPLDGAGIAEAASALFGLEPPAEMVGQLAALSGGLPLALREVFRELMAAEHIVPGGDSDRWVWKSEALSDDDLRAVGDRVHGFSGRLASLPETERRILALAAYLGEQFNRDLLRRLAERTIGWDDRAFERLILGGFISVATPSIRLGAQEQEGRVCYAFMHTLLWKAAAGLGDEIPSREDLALTALEILTSGVGELYGVVPLEGADVAPLSESSLDALFRWLVAVGRRLSPIYAETFTALCRAVLEPFRSSGRAKLEGALLESYLAALSAYGDRLYVTGAREPLHSLAEEIASTLERLAPVPPTTAEERIIRLDAAVIVWKDALMRGEPTRAKGYLDELLTILPPPAEQTDRELRGAAEAIRLLASDSFARGEFAAMFDLAAPYLDELDRMRPETLNALMKVLLYALMSAGRMEEAREMVEAGLRLRREADMFTEYELLLHAANYAQRTRDLKSVRGYATELRGLIDRYPTYRNLSTNYWHLPDVAACEAKIEELTQLEREFNAIPPPARSTSNHVAVAQLRFLWAWTSLGMSERAIKVAEEIDQSVLSPLQQWQVAEQELRACINGRWVARIGDVEQKLNMLSARIGGGYPADGSVAGRRLAVLRLLADVVSREQPDLLCERIAGMTMEEIEDVDAFSAARILLEFAEKSPGRKREFNDAAYTAIELALNRVREDGLNAIAHYYLDSLGQLLPKTRLIKFRQMIGDDPRGLSVPETLSEGSSESVSSDRILRTFGALRIEGSEEVGSKLESETRTLVAALVTVRLGDVRWIGELTRDRLADLLWPDMSLDRAVNNLHATLSYARRFLGGSDTVVQRDGVYALGDDVVIDAVEFRECVEKGNRLHTEGVYFGAAVAYRRAIDFATGDFLEGMYAEWIDNTRETLRGELATALERLIAIEIERENYGAVPPLAERLLALDDLHDGAYEALIRSAAARGARKEAFSYYTRYEAALDAYGAGPARRITELINRVRAGDA